MPVSSPAAPSPALRAARGVLAAALVGGVALALPSSAEAAYVDETGRLAVPAPVAVGDLAYDFATCPDAPPTQGQDVWAYELPAEVALPGTAVTVTGTDAAGEVALAGFVYQDDCTYTRVADATETGGLSVVLEGTERRLVVSTTNGVETSLLLTAVPGGAVPDPTATATPTAEPTDDPGSGGGGPVVRRDYSGGVDDPFYPEPAGLLPTDAVGDVGPGGQWGMRVIRAEQAWQEQRATGAGITVAVLDSGLDVTHEEFACEGKLARLDAARYPRFADVTDTDGHGTHVAGIVGACTDNGTGVVGTAPDATILPVAALVAEDSTAERLAEAIDAAVDSGAHVINMSLGFSAQGLPATGSAVALVGGFAADVDPAIERAVAAGVVVVAASGNETAPLCGYPAIAADVVCVGSTDRRDVPAYFSNFPVTPDGVALMAPGGSGQVFCDVQSENVLSTYSRQAEQPCAYPADGYAGLDGTSMASPHVAGVAALVYDRIGGERSPGNAARVVEALRSTAVDLGAPGYDPLTGDGRVDALAAVQSVPPAGGDVDPTPTPTGTATATPTPTPTQTTQPDVQTATELFAPSVGQTTDELPLEAQVEGDGAPLAGVPVVFELTGQGGTRTVEAVTGEDGVARSVLRLDTAPGAYDLSATVAPRPGRTGSSDRQVVDVQQDVPSLTAAHSGNGSGTRVSAVLTDADDARGLAGRQLLLVADGREAGTATTGEDGTAVFAPSGGDRNARSYEVRFAGDPTYTAAATTTPGKKG